MKNQVERISASKQTTKFSPIPQKSNSRKDESNPTTTDGVHETVKINKEGNKKNI